MNTARIVENTSVNMGDALMGKVAGLNVSIPNTGPGGSSSLGSAASHHSEVIIPH